MTLLLETPPLPLRTDKDGAVRVSGTRVTLDSIVGAYNRGQNAEEISRNFDSVPLRDIHAVISYYLGHRQEVDEYLEAREAEADRLQALCGFDGKAVKARLEARRRPGQAE